MSGLLDRGKSIIKAESYWGAQPARVHGYTEYGTARDNLLLRIAATHKSDVLTRVHLGPYSKDRPEALHTFDMWCKDLARSKHLDILSIGSSQLSQSKFEEPWHSHDNGGGVPINSKSEFRAIVLGTHSHYGGSTKTMEGGRSISNLASLSTSKR